MPRFLTQILALAIGLSLSFATEGAFAAGTGTIETAQAASDSSDEPAAPAAEPPARDYLVYFDFDSADIRPDAASILDRVAQAVFNVGSSNVTLVGHADTSGPNGYNQWLSEQRAFAVREYLLGKGIAVQVIAKGRGEEAPRVMTKDGVEEQENRRVEIRSD
jgi:outer membrane protein OmpA-like peptidoglycan-associated protein